MYNVIKYKTTIVNIPSYIFWRFLHFHDEKNDTNYVNFSSEKFLV